MTSYTCKCDKVCKDYDEYVSNHVDNISSWADHVEMHEMVADNKPNIEQMLVGEPFARKRREAKARKIAAGYVPQPQVRCKGPKPFCFNCVVEDGKVVANYCCNKKCTFNHGKFDRRAHIKMAFE